MRLSVKVHVESDTTDPVFEVGFEEEELKERLPELYLLLDREWHRVGPQEERDFEANLKEGDLDMDWMGECNDACHVEPDGRCPHGYYSIGIRKGLI